MDELDNGHLGRGDGQHVPHPHHPLQLVRQDLDQLVEMKSKRGTQCGAAEFNFLRKLICTVK